MVATIFITMLDLCLFLEEDKIGKSISSTSLQVRLAIGATISITSSRKNFYLRSILDFKTIQS